MWVAKFLKNVYLVRFEHTKKFIFVNGKDEKENFVYITQNGLFNACLFCIVPAYMK